MAPAKKKKGKGGGKKKAQGSLLTRLLKGKGKKKSKDQKAASTAGRKAEASEKPPTPLDRSIREIKQLLGVGQSDPERLALLLSNILGAEREKQEKEQQKFDEMVWDLVIRREQGEEGAVASNGHPPVNGNGREGLN